MPDILVGTWVWIVEPYIGRVATGNYIGNLGTWSYIWQSAASGKVNIMDMGALGDGEDKDDNIVWIQDAAYENFDGATEANLIIASHGHYDHVGKSHVLGEYRNLRDLKDSMGGSIACHYCDVERVNLHLKNNLQEPSQVDVVLLGPTGPFDENENPVCDFTGDECGNPNGDPGFSLRVFHCPGHTDGTIALVSEDILLTGSGLHLMIIGDWFKYHRTPPEDDPLVTSENIEYTISQATRMFECFGDGDNVFMSHFPQVFPE